jgi:tripartite-type tricarboxylate transporter receptor subunit TctC
MITTVDTVVIGGGQAGLSVSYYLTRHDQDHKGTPEAVINKASADLRAVLVKPEIRDKLAARGSFVRPMTPQEVLNYINDQQTLWKPALERVAVQTQK